MTPRWRAALLWGVVGTLAFLVFHQGYLLAGGDFVGYGPVAVVAVAVFGVTTVASYYLVGHFVVGGPATDAETVSGRSDASADDSGDWVWAGEQSEANRDPENGSQ